MLICINQIDRRIYDRKENIGKRWNKKKKYTLVVFRTQCTIRAIFIKEVEQSTSTIKC
jgi:hypothetical protein